MSGIEVIGGVAGLSVRLDELTSAAATLRRRADDLLDLTLVMAGLLADPAVVAAGAVAPAELAEVEGEVLAVCGPAGAAGAAARILATGVATDLAADAYRRGEVLVEQLADAAASAVGVWVGTALGSAVGAVAAPAAGVGVVAVPLVGAVMAVPGGERVVEAVGDGAVDVGRGLAGEVDELLFDQPWLVPAAADGLDGFVTGLGRGLPPLGAWLGWSAARAGVAYPPRTRAEALGVIVAAASGVALDESDQRVRVRAREPRRVTAPRSVHDLVAHDGPTSGGDRLRVTGIRGPGGQWRWIVDVPGTQSLDPRAGRNPWDLTSNVLLAAGEVGLTGRAVALALDDARRRTGATESGPAGAGRQGQWRGGPGRARAGRARPGPVMLTGHSQGGLTAAALAANPDFRARNRVTHVVTSGAPIGQLPVPEEVSVLSLEHDEDLVPGLDGAPNPDRATWVTVRRDLEADLGEEAGATDAHRSRYYAETARLVDASDHPSLTAWRSGAAPFLGEPGSLLGSAQPPPEVVVIDYDVTREPR